MTNHLKIPFFVNTNEDILYIKCLNCGDTARLKIEDYNDFHTIDSFKRKYENHFRDVFEIKLKEYNDVNSVIHPKKSKVDVDNSIVDLTQEENNKKNKEEEHMIVCKQCYKRRINFGIIIDDLKLKLRRIYTIYKSRKEAHDKKLREEEEEKEAFWKSLTFDEKEEFEKMYMQELKMEKYELYKKIMHNK
jgi:ssDNA-binding Zn-finger/Zn-ribbon topoisomerase 1